MGRADDNSKILCPRCGYDQRGELAKWTDRCPLQSTCTECGLRIDWREVLSDRFAPPPWLVESAPSVWSIPKRTWKTALVMFRPWKAFRELRMSHPVRGWRLGGFVLAHLIVLYAIFAINHGALVWREQAGDRPVERLGHAAWSAFWPGSERPIPIIPGTAMTFTSRQLLTWERHEWMIWIKYEIRDWWVGPDHVDDSTRGVFFAQFWTGVLLLGPLTFSLLPVTRRRAKVRWAHIWRLAFYSSPIALPLLGLSITGFMLFDKSFGMTSAAEIPLAWPLFSLATWLTPIWLVLWWMFAVKHYLRMPHAFAVAITVVLLPAVIVFSILTLTFLTWN